MSDKELVKKDADAVSIMQQAGLTDYTGFENIEEGMLSFPWLKIAQALSPEISGAVPVDGLKQGDFFNSMTKRIYGKDALIIFLSFDHSYIEWDAEGGSVPVNRYSTEDLKEAVKAKLVTQVDGFRFYSDPANTKTEVKETYTFACIMADYPEDGILFFSMKSLGAKYAKKIINMSRVMRVHGRAANFPELVWGLTSTKYINANGQASFQLGDGKNMTCSIMGNVYDAGFEKVQPAIVEAVQLARTIQFKKVDMAASVEHGDDIPF